MPHRHGTQRQFPELCRINVNRVGGSFSSRPLTPPCVPFGTRRLGSISARTRIGQGCCSVRPVRVFHLSWSFSEYHFRLEVVEQKTGKRRIFPVPLVIQQYMENYCLRCGIRRNDLIFPITERAVQKQLRIVCDYLGIDGISTHSFRKWYATEIYNANGFDIALVQRLLQHSSASTTQRYIGIEPQRIEQVIQNHAHLLCDVRGFTYSDIYLITRDSLRLPR